MAEIVKFTTNTCSVCGMPTNDKIKLIDCDTGEDAGAKFVCSNCLPANEDSLRILLDRKDMEIAALVKALTEIRDFPYVGLQASKQTALIAGEALHRLVGGGQLHD